mgnify:CR=1 FL=1
MTKQQLKEPHIIEFNKLGSPQVGYISVNELSKDTPFVTLDGLDRKLDADDLMICDDLKPLSLAGIFGGKDSGVS